METKSRIIVIAGPTASGKTTAAIQLALKYSGEIICADSRTIYNGMDIGTAKPTAKEMQDISHYGLNLVTPGERFTAVDFQRFAKRKIIEIQSRGKLPIVVGGTGLYINALVYNYDFPLPPNAEQRVLFTNMTLSELYKYCIKNNVELSENDKNKRHLIRSIIQNTQFDSSHTTIDRSYIVVGIATEKQTLYDRILHRSEQMFANNVVDEAIKLGEKYGWDNEAMTGNVYRIIKKYLNSEITLEQAVKQNSIADRQLAKRQMTWFRRNPHIEWCSIKDIEHYITNRLAN